MKEFAAAEPTIKMFDDFHDRAVYDYHLKCETNRSDFALMAVNNFSQRGNSISNTTHTIIL